MGKIKPGVWPWLVTLRRKEMVNPDDDYLFDSYDSHDNVTYEWRHFCGGTILSRNHILTAAHCVAKITNLDSFKIRAGDVLLNNNIDNEGIQEVSIKNFTKHPKYHLRYFDLAVLELAFPLNFTKVVKPICLLSLEEAMNITKADEEYLPLAIAGYGNNGDALNHGVATVFSEETCNRTHPAERDYRNLVPNLFTEDTMCAGDISGEAGTCRGDSGSGAVHFHQNRQQYILRAVVSGSARGECGSMLYPNVYVRMATPDIMQWIFDEINFSSPKSVVLSKEKTIQSGEEVAKYSCTSSPSRPASTIKWTITDANENYVKYENKLETVEETPEGFISISSFALVKPTKGIVECEAENIVGKQISNNLNSTGFGWFLLESLLQERLVLQYGDIPVVTNRSDDDLQLWKFDGEQIVSKKNGKVLDIKGGTNAAVGPNATVIMWKKHGGINQQFKFEQNEIISVRDKTVLSVMEAGGNETQVHMELRNGTNAQKWRQIFPDSRWFLLECFVEEGLVLEYGNIPVVRKRSDNDLQLQLWKFDGKQIVSKNNGYVLDIKGGTNAITGSKATAIMWPKHGGTNQQFKLEHNLIVSIRDNTVLSVMGSRGDGAQVHMYHRNENRAQKWRQIFID